MKPRGLAVFASDVNLFENTLTTSVVLFLEKNPLGASAFRGRCVRSAMDLVDFVSSMEKGAAVQPDELDLASFDPDDKWLNRLFACSPRIASLGAILFKCKENLSLDLENVCEPLNSSNCG